MRKMPFGVADAVSLELLGYRLPDTIPLPGVWRHDRNLIQLHWGRERCVSLHIWTSRNAWYLYLMAEQWWRGKLTNWDEAMLCLRKAIEKQ
jgi:hypothetical protein